MSGFQIFDGNADQYDNRELHAKESRFYEVGFSVKLIEFAGILTPPYPVLANAI